MSTDFLQVDDDANGVSVLLSMKASGDAFLTVQGDFFCVYYHLPPNETGWRNAESIVDAIENWINHSKVKERHCDD
jgi:hypothetical protein